MTPSNQLPNASADNAIGQGMFSNMAGQSPTQSPEQDKSMQGATGVVKGFVSVQAELKKWAEANPEVSKAVDQALKQLTNAMYKVAMQSDSKEGKQESL